MHSKAKVHQCHSIKTTQHAFNWTDIETPGLPSLVTATLSLTLMANGHFLICVRHLGHTNFNSTVKNQCWQLQEKVSYILYKVSSIPARGIYRWSRQREVETFIMWQLVPESKRCIYSCSYLVNDFGNSRTALSVWTVPIARLSTNNWPPGRVISLCRMTHCTRMSLSTTSNWRLTTNLKDLQ